jgi:hypothetical protein
MTKLLMTVALQECTRRRRTINKAERARVPI